VKRIVIVCLVLCFCLALSANVLDPGALIGSRKNPVSSRTIIQTEVIEDGRKLGLVDLAINGVIRGTLADMYLLALQVSEGDEIPSIQNVDREYMLVVFSVENINGIASLGHTALDNGKKDVELLMSKRIIQQLDHNLLIEYSYPLDLLI